MNVETRQSLIVDFNELRLLLEEKNKVKLSQRTVDIRIEYGIKEAFLTWPIINENIQPAIPQTTAE